MSLWEPGTLSLSLEDLTKLRDIAWRDHKHDSEYMREYHPDAQPTFLINEILPMPADHPDNVWAREEAKTQKSEHSCMVEVTYNTCGHRAGYGLSYSGEWHCFYD